MMRPRPLRILCAALLMVASFLLFSGFPSSIFNGPRSYKLLEHGLSSQPSRPDNLYGQTCSPFAGGLMDNVTIVLKMGDGEVAKRLPSYLDHLGECKQDLLLFSDREAEHDGLAIHDALANLPSEYRDKHPDFALYNAIQRSSLGDEKTNDGWRLDKYKFLPMMELARHFRAKSEWFVFIELDTYVNWDNMHRFLAHFDPQKPLYFGSPVWPAHKPAFAHGGSGFVLSGAALDKLVAYGKRFAASRVLPGAHMFGQDMELECCGDEVLARVLKASGVPFRGYWPMFNGEKPFDVTFGPQLWCEAILTLHHLGVEDFVALDKWEASSLRTRSKPLTFEELFTHVEPSLKDRRDDWTNRSDDVVLEGNQTGASVDACHSACANDLKCLQYEHIGNTCRLSHAIRLGHSQPPDASKKWTSGWMLDRINAFKAAHSPCDGAHLISANP